TVPFDEGPQAGRPGPRLRDDRSGRPAVAAVGPPGQGRGVDLHLHAVPAARLLPADGPEVRGGVVAGGGGHGAGGPPAVPLGELRPRARPPGRPRPPRPDPGGPAPALVLRGRA